MKKLYYLIAMALMGLTFTSCEDVPAPFGQPQNPNQQETIDPTGTGTATDPFNVAGVLKYVKDLGADVESTTDVYFTGIVTSVTEAFGTQYGNATFTVADTETSKTIFTFYRGLYLGNKKYDDATAVNVKEGDKVVICGKVVYYKGSTPETAQGKAYVVSINGTGGGDTPTPPSTETIGTKDAPITVAQALEYITPLADNGTTDKEAFVAGTIKQIKTAEDKIAQYKNIDYIITDGTNDITVFRGKNLDNTDFTAAGQINVGDKVVVRGKLTKYVKDSNTTPEIAQGNYLVSLTKGSDGGGDTGGGDAGSNLLNNGNFETWESGQPTGWKSASTESSATLEQCTYALGVS
jgi:RPA family protein